MEISADDNRYVCPNCTNDYQDGLGPFTRTVKKIRPGSSVVLTEYWYELRCPDCDTVFAIRKRVETRNE